MSTSLGEPQVTTWACLAAKATVRGSLASYAPQAPTAPAVTKGTPVVRSSWRSATRTLGLGLVSLTLAPLTLLPQAADASTGTQGPTAAVTASSASPLKLWAPNRVDAYTYGSKRVWTDLGLRVIAQNAPFELLSTRADGYEGDITTVWHTATADK